jgi:hypothetical protein
MAVRGRRDAGLLVLSIFLILTGLIGLGLSFPGLGVVVALLAIGAGVLLLVDMRRINIRQNLGMLLLAIWLIATGLVALIPGLSGLGLILALLALAAGILLLIGR